MTPLLSPQFGGNNVNDDCKPNPDTCLAALYGRLLVQSTLFTHTVKEQWQRLRLRS